MARPVLVPDDHNEVIVDFARGAEVKHTPLLSLRAPSRLIEAILEASHA
jgi:hypothetical protein